MSWVKSRSVQIAKVRGSLYPSFDCPVDLQQLDHVPVSEELVLHMLAKADVLLTAHYSILNTTGQVSVLGLVV